MQEKLYTIRRRKGYTQEYIAKQLGISKTQYGLKERGVYEFTSDEMFSLSELFGDKIDNIFMPRSHRIGDK